MSSFLQNVCRQFIWVIIVFYFISCYSEVVKPINYLSGEMKYTDCMGFFEKDRLERVICLNRDSVVIVEHKYKLGSIYSYVKKFYDTGELKEEGGYSRNQQIGVWKSYYPNGVLKEYRFYRLQEKIDSSSVIYKKEYSTEGDLLASYLPVEVMSDSIPEIFELDSTYNLYVKLLYSEYDSVNSAGILDSSPSSSLAADSTIFYGNSLHYEFTPVRKGKHIISGTYFEMDGKHEYVNEKNIAERPFIFEYVVE